MQLSYGFEHRTETADSQLKLAMLAGAGVSRLTVQGTEVLVTQLAKKVMTTPYHSAPMQAAVKALAAKVGINLTHKSFAKAVPLVGGAVNGSVQGGLVNVGGRRIVATTRNCRASVRSVQVRYQRAVRASPWWSQRVAVA